MTDEIFRYIPQNRRIRTVRLGAPYIPIPHRGQTRATTVDPNIIRQVEQSRPRTARGTPQKQIVPAARAGCLPKFRSAEARKFTRFAKANSSKFTASIGMTDAAGPVAPVSATPATLWLAHQTDKNRTGENNIEGSTLKGYTQSNHFPRSRKRACATPRQVPHGSTALCGETVAIRVGSRDATFHGSEVSAAGASPPGSTAICLSCFCSLCCLLLPQLCPASPLSVGNPLPRSRRKTTANRGLLTCGRRHMRAKKLRNSADRILQPLQFLLYPASLRL